MYCASLPFGERETAPPQTPLLMIMTHKKTEEERLICNLWNQGV